MSDKGSSVRELFAAIAPRYDLANRAISGGLDESWRRRAIRELCAGSGDRLLDLCCGTGDLALALARSIPGAKVTGVDFCEPMLEGARRRSLRERNAASIQFRTADVTALPFEDRSFEGAIMGFSLRNIVDLDVCLREARRVIVPGGRFVNLDLSHPPNPALEHLFGVYLFRLVPLIGGLISRNYTAYRYLPSSLINFPGAEALAERLARAGFSSVRFVRLMGGLIAIHVGTA